MILEYNKNIYLVSTDKSKLQINVIHNFLKDAYWSKNIPKEYVGKSIEHSLCYGVYCDNKQVGFARVITDYVALAYIADVFIVEEHSGKGLSKWLMECLLANPELQSVRGWSLKTKDAHGLYKKFGFIPPEIPEWIMERKVFKSY